jgi:hypothetical protein
VEINAAGRAADINFITSQLKEYFDQIQWNEDIVVKDCLRIANNINISR